MKKIYWMFIAVLAFVACQNEPIKDITVQKIVNPPAEGFNSKDSDPKAIEIADKVMIAMGGRAAWDSTEVLEWDFFGVRTLKWDRVKKHVTIDNHRKDEYFEYDIANDKVKVFRSGKPVTDADELLSYKTRAKGIWINDSYWLVMPFKLKDSGVTLKYLGEEVKLFYGSKKSKVDVLQLTFESVGITPDNRYLVYVDQKDNLIKAWRFYTDKEDKESTYYNTWLNYQKYGGILLSDVRGKDTLMNISVSKSEDIVE